MTRNKVPLWYTPFLIINDAPLGLRHWKVSVVIGFLAPIIYVTFVISVLLFLRKCKNRHTFIRGCNIPLNSVLKFWKLQDSNCSCNQVVDSFGESFESRLFPKSSPVGYLLAQKWSEQKAIILKFKTVHQNLLLLLLLITSSNHQYHDIYVYQYHAYVAISKSSQNFNCS